MTTARTAGIALLAVATWGQASYAGATPAPAARDEYVFVLDTERLVVIQRGQWNLVGNLDADGNFTESNRYPLGSLSGPFYYINKIGTHPHVYEYRSGRLIKGEMKRNGVFIPEAGSTVIDFKDYHYAPEGPPIWNLPGRFVKKSELDQKNNEKK